jgi:hypothetical protein
MALTLTETKVIQIGQSESLVYGHDLASSPAHVHDGRVRRDRTQIPGSTEYEVFDRARRRLSRHYDGAGKFRLGLPADGPTAALVEVPNGDGRSSSEPDRSSRARPELVSERGARDRGSARASPLRHSVLGRGAHAGSGWDLASAGS